MSIASTNNKVASLSNYTISFNRSMDAQGLAITPSYLTSNYLINLVFDSSFTITSSTNIQPTASAVNPSTNTITLNLTQAINTITLTSFTNPLPSNNPLSIALNFYNASNPTVLVDTSTSSLTFQPQTINTSSMSYTFQPGNVSTAGNMSISLIPWVWTQTKMNLNLNLLTYWSRNQLNVSSNQILSAMTYCTPACTIKNTGSFFTLSLPSLPLTNNSLTFTIYNILSPATLEIADSISLLLT